MAGEVDALEKRDVAKGNNAIEYRYINLGAKNTASMRPGERIIIHTPGGGGWERKARRAG